MKTFVYHGLVLNKKTKLKLIKSLNKDVHANNLIKQLNAAVEFLNCLHIDVTKDILKELPDVEKKC